MMASEVEIAPEIPGPRRVTQRHRVRGALVLLMGCLSIVVPFVAGWSLLVGREVELPPRDMIPPESRHPDRRLGLPAHQEFTKLQAGFGREEAARRRIDAAWCWTFVGVFFAVHIGRMQVEWN